MGCPEKFYRRALRNFSQKIDAGTDESHTNPQETSKLEERILSDKNSMEQSEFYFLAGQTWIETIQEAEKEGGDALNACIGGLNEFERLIGLTQDTD